MTAAEGVLSGVGTILYFDCGGGYTNLHIGLNSIELQTHTHTTAYKNGCKLKNVCSLVNSIVPMSITWFWYYIAVINITGESWEKVYKTVLFLQLLVNI